MSECGECDTLKCYNITDALVRKLVHGKNVFIRTDITQCQYLDNAKWKDIGS